MTDYEPYSLDLGPYFGGLEKFLEKRFEHDKNHLRDIADALSHVENLSDISRGPHQRSLAELFQNNQSGELLGLISEFQGRFIREHPESESINFYDPEGSHHLQSIMETVEKAAR